jgi:hypothetical protein
VGGDRGKMSSFPDPLELGQLEHPWDEEDPSVFDRVTAVPGEVPDAPPDGTAGADDPVSGLHQRATSDEPLTNVRERVLDDTLPPVLGGAPESTRARVKSKPSPAPHAPQPAATQSESTKSTGTRRSPAKRPVLELELEDIESKAPPPPGRRADALEAPVPERPRQSALVRERPVTEPVHSRATQPIAEPPRPSEPEPAFTRITRPIEPPPDTQPFLEPILEQPLPVSQPQTRPEVLDMRDRYATGDFTGALVVAESLLEREPEHEEARRCYGRCTEVLAQMYLARLGSPAQAVRVAVPNDQIKWLSLDHRAGFLLSLVDGHLTVEELLDISSMARLDALRILSGLLDQRVIALCERP